MLTPTTPNFNCDSPPFLIEIKRRDRNGHQRSTPNFFVGAKTLKLKVTNYSNFTITFPTIWRCAGDFFKGFSKNLKWQPLINFIFYGHKNLNIIKVGHYSNFTIIFPTIWTSVGDIFSVLLKFKMAATDHF